MILSTALIYSLVHFRTTLATPVPAFDPACIVDDRMRRVSLISASRRVLRQMVGRWEGVLRSAIGPNLTAGYGRPYLQLVYVLALASMVAACGETGRRMNVSLTKQSIDSSTLRQTMKAVSICV